MLVNAFSLNGSSMAKINIATPPNNGENGKFKVNSITLKMSETKAHFNVRIKCLYLYKYIPASIKYPPLKPCYTVN